ncbi:MAG: metallopeptidase TldD-related protein [Pseudomonadota bacterium]
MQAIITDVPPLVDRGAAQAPGCGYFERFGVSAELLRRVLGEALSQGGEDADLFFEHATSTMVALTDGAVNRASTGVELGMGVRVVVGDQVGYATTEVLTPEAMVSAARTAARIAAGGGRHAPVHFQPRRYADRYPVQRRWETVGIEERLPLLRTWEADTFARDPRVSKVQAYLMDGERVILIARPDGRLVQDHQPMTVAFVTCTAEEGGRRESASYNLAARSGMEFWDDRARGQRLAEEAVDRALFLLSAGAPPAGELPVVLGPGASGILLHEAVGHGLEADFCRKGISIYGGLLGQQVASEQVTVVDDGTLPGARGSINTDDEGNPAERSVLIERGVLKGFLHDEISARHFGVAPTGSGRRESFRHPPLPRMRVTFMEAGAHAPEDVIKGVEKGIYCASFANGQVQIGAGDFAFYMRHGYLIEHGRLTRPIKDANIVGNGPEALRRVQLVGNDLVLDEGGWTCGKDGQGVPVGQGLPTVLVSGLVVGGVG